MIGCLKKTTTCVVAKPLVIIIFSFIQKSEILLYTILGGQSRVIDENVDFYRIEMTDFMDLLVSHCT